MLHIKAYYFSKDVKSFLNGFLNVEIYWSQPPSFINEKKSNHVFKLTKVFYDLKQASRACMKDWVHSKLKIDCLEKKLTP